MGAIQIINRAVEDCRSIENKQSRQEKVALLESGMDALKQIKFGVIPSAGNAGDRRYASITAAGAGARNAVSRARNEYAIMFQKYTSR